MVRIVRGGLGVELGGPGGGVEVLERVGTKGDEGGGAGC